MSIIEILMYSTGSVFFFSAVAYTYYSIKSARIMKGALGRKMMAYGAVLFIIAGVIGAIDVFFFPIFFPTSGLRLGAFFLWAIALSILIIGSFVAVEAVRKVYPASYLQIVRIYPGAIYYFIGMVILILVGIPLSILDNMQPPVTGEFTWYSVINIVARAIGFVNLALGSRIIYLTAKPSAAAAAAAAAAAGGAEIALLRDDIIAVRSYGTITNIFLVTAKLSLSDKPFRDVLTEHFEYNPLLFEGCEIKEDGIINMEPIIKNLDRISGENRVHLLCSAFSTLNTKIMNLYGAVTSPELAKKRLEESYLSVKKQYGDLPIFFEILRTLPEGVLEEERLGLLSREELEARVKERTAELEKALEDVKKAKERVEKLVKLEKERAEELKDARDVTLSVLEDTDEAKRELEKAKTELEKAKTGLEERVKERSAELGQTYQKLVKIEAAAAAAAAADKARAEEAEKYSKKLKKAYDKLKTLDKMKSEFISMAAHELRTPLTPVKTYVEMIMDKKYGYITVKQKEKLMLIDKSIDRLGILIDDMLNITRIEAGKLEAMKKPLFIEEIMDTALDEALSLFGERKHRITIDVPDDLPPVCADEKLIVRVFSNLLNNAMKYTPARGKITVTAKSEGKNIHITVADTGIGIPKKEQTKIFDKFYVVDIIHTSKHRGIGLGLTIAKGIVKAHNGKIWAESKGLGEGSTFHVLLPVTEKEK